MENCLFCKIATGEVASFRVWEDANYLAFLDIMPIKDGHTLVIPKKHLPYLFDLEDQDLHGVTSASKKVSLLLKKAFNPKSGKIGLIVYGLDIDHLHIHLVPIDKPGDLDFHKKSPTPKEKLEEVLNKIKAAS